MGLLIIGGAAGHWCYYAREQGAAAVSVRDGGRSVSATHASDTQDVQDTGEGSERGARGEQQERCQAEVPAEVPAAVEEPEVKSAAAHYLPVGQRSANEKPVHPAVVKR